MAMQDQMPSTVPGPVWSRVEKCPLCGSDDMQPYLRARDHHYGNPGEFILGRCRRCNLVLLNPMPDAEALGSFYPDDTYYAYQGFDFEEASGLLPRLRSRVRDWAILPTAPVEPRFPSAGRVLDLGSGSGKFLHDARRRGWETHGVEISIKASEFGRREAGLDIFAGTLHDARYPDGHFDYVRANHTYEHVLDSNEVTAEVYRILKPGGKVMIGVPNVTGLNARLFGRHWYYLCPPVHTFNYSDATLPRLLEKHGFQIERVRHNGNYQGVLGSIQLLLNRGTGRPATEGSVFEGRGLRVVASIAARLFNWAGVGDIVEVTAVKPGPEMEGIRTITTLIPPLLRRRCAAAAILAVVVAGVVRAWRRPSPR